MKDEQTAGAATPHEILIAEIMDSRVAKTEREHAAAREITRLRSLAARAEDVEGIGRVSHEAEFSTDYDTISEAGKEECLRIARAVVAYLRGEGK